MTINHSCGRIHRRLDHFESLAEGALSSLQSLFLQYFIDVWYHLRRTHRHARSCPALSLGALLLEGLTNRLGGGGLPIPPCEIPLAPAHREKEEEDGGVLEVGEEGPPLTDLLPLPRLKLVARPDTDSAEPEVGLEKFERGIHQEAKLKSKSHKLRNPYNRLDYSD